MNIPQNNKNHNTPFKAQNQRFKPLNGVAGTQVSKFGESVLNQGKKAFTRISKPKSNHCTCLYCYYALLRPDNTQKMDNLICYIDPEKTRKVAWDWFCEFGKKRHEKTVET